MLAIEGRKSLKDIQYMDTDRRMLAPIFGAVTSGRKKLSERCNRCWFLNCGAHTCTLEGSVPIPKCYIVVQVQMLWKEGDL